MVLILCFIFFISAINPIIDATTKEDNCLLAGDLVQCTNFVGPKFGHHTPQHSTKVTKLILLGHFERVRISPHFTKLNYISFESTKAVKINFSDYLHSPLIEHFVARKVGDIIIGEDAKVFRSLAVIELHIADQS